MQIDEISPPGGTFLADQAAQEAHYADCFEVGGITASLPDFIAAFCTQPLFKAERLVLRLGAGAPSSDAEARALAEGALDRFAIWTVKARSDSEILLADTQSHRTLLWLSVGQGLRFGSVVVPVRNRRGKLVLGPVFDSLLGAHKLYSRALLAGAARRVKLRP